VLFRSAVLVQTEKALADFGNTATTPTWVANNNWQCSGLSNPGAGGVPIAGIIFRNNIVPVGYADGYPVALSSDRACNPGLDSEHTARVGFEISTGIRAYAPVVGRVSMDQIIIDVTDLPERATGVGAPVEIVGNNPSAPNHLATLATIAGTITHELLCRMSPRLERRYLHLPKPVEQERPAERITRALEGAGGIPSNPLALREVESKRLIERMAAAQSGIR
jgi:hypothetical protein